VLGVEESGSGYESGFGYVREEELAMPWPLPQFGSFMVDMEVRVRVVGDVWRLMIMPPRQLPYSSYALAWKWLYALSSYA
jgi:hypothetical protein